MGSGKNKNVPIANQSVVSQQTTWSGPIPDPQSLAAFKNLVPDAPERILAMAEEEARIRREVMQRDHESENRTREADVLGYHNGVKRGQYFSFIIIMSCIAGAIACSLHGDVKTAIALAGGGFAGIAYQFIASRAKK